MANNYSDSSVDSTDVDVLMNRIDCTSIDIHSHRATPADIFLCKNLSDVIRYILSNDTSQNNNQTQLTDDEVRIFEKIEQLRVSQQKMFMDLIEYFTTHFDIDLYIIAVEKGKFSVIKKDNHDKANMAFLSFNEDNTVNGPVCIINSHGTTQTIFFSDDTDIQLDVYAYLQHLNGSKLANDSLSTRDQQNVQCVQESNENPSINNNSASSTNQLHSFDSAQANDQAESHALIDQILQRIVLLFDGFSLSSDLVRVLFQPFLSNSTAVEYLSIHDVVTALKDGTNCLSILAQIIEECIVIPTVSIETDQIGTSTPTTTNHINSQHVEIQHEINHGLTNIEIPSNSSLPSETSASTSNNNSLTNEQSINVKNNYDPPRITKPLKNKFYTRTLKEFAKTASSPVQCVNSKQREPFQISIPPDDGTLLYLGMGVVDREYQDHLTKVIVPDKTKAKGHSFINNNDLRCFDFTAFNPDNKFDRESKEIHSKISLAERKALHKDIRIHILNLYQREKINRKIVEERQLKKFMLAFWYCVLENGIYKQVSSKFYSDIIEETKKGTSKKKKKIVNKQKETSIDVR